MSCGASTFDGVVEPNRVWRNWNGDIEFRPDQYFEPAHSEPDVLARTCYPSSEANPSPVI
jgi:hypothetical protein